MQKSVSEDRNKFVGGSDIPIIMGISQFKTRFDLLLEKAEYLINDFDGNEYTEYGNIMEPKIRDYINKELGKKFKEDKYIKEDIRCHVDGIDGTSVLEIKTTSQIKKDVDEYKVYLVQLLFYMYHTNRRSGLLAVYDRPKDFNEEFDYKRLQLFVVNIDNYKDLIQQINDSVDRFRIDLEKVKKNPFITEEELMPIDLTEISEKLIAVEKQLILYDEVVKLQKELKADLKKAMEENNIKKWTTLNGTQITLIADTPDKEVEVEVFDEDKFIKENTELHQNYHNKLAEYKTVRTEIKKGKTGYVKITLSKNDV